MKPSAPKKIIWIIALVAGILGIIGKYTSAVSELSANSFSLLLVGFVLLALGTTFKEI